MFAIPFRQVHLDFHTSEHIPIQLRSHQIVVFNY